MSPRFHVLFILLLVLLQGCEEKPRQLKVTLTPDLAKTQECHGRCDMQREVAKKKALTCMNEDCERKYAEWTKQCRDPECPCSHNRDSCLTAAFLHLEACQDSCTSRLQAAVTGYDKCMEECQGARAPDSSPVGPGSTSIEYEK